MCSSVIGYVLFFRIYGLVFGSEPNAVVVCCQISDWTVYSACQAGPSLCSKWTLEMIGFEICRRGSDVVDSSAIGLLEKTKVTKGTADYWNQAGIRPVFR